MNDVTGAKRLQVRQRFEYRCGYCGVTEADAGGELTIDHFVPRVAGGDDSDDNLIYCCVRCNLYKAALDPVTQAGGHARLLHPLTDDLSLHIREVEETGVLSAQTPTGEYHIKALHLNRPALIQHRLERRLKQRLIERNGLLEEANERLQETIASQRRVIRRLAGLKRRKPQQ